MFPGAVHVTSIIQKRCSCSQNNPRYFLVWEDVKHNGTLSSRSLPSFLGAAVTCPPCLTPNPVIPTTNPTPSGSIYGICKTVLESRRPWWVSTALILFLIRTGIYESADISMAALVYQVNKEMCRDKITLVFPLAERETEVCLWEGNVTDSRRLVYQVVMILRLLPLPLGDAAALWAHSSACLLTVWA